VKPARALVLKPKRCLFMNLMFQQTSSRGEGSHAEAPGSSRHHEENYNH